MGGDAGDVLLEFGAELGEAHDVLNGGDFVETDDGGGGFEYGNCSLYEGGVDLALVGGGELESVGFGDELHGSGLQLVLGALDIEKVTQKVAVGARE